MAITTTYTLAGTFTGGNAAKSFTISTSLTDAQVFEHATTVAASTSLTYTETIDVSQIKSLFIKADGVLTLLVNDDGTPDVTLVLAANNPIYWTSTMGTACPLGSVDATSWKITNGTASGIDFYFHCAVDPV